GALDASFGSGGKTLVPFDLVSHGGDLATDVIEQGNGKLVFSGYAANSADGSAIDAAVVRLNADGTPDTQFGTLGKRAIDFSLTLPGAQLAFGVALRPRRILIGGGVLTSTAGDVDVFVAGLENSLIFANGFE
ncbi:MAG: delta-60 repeat domain-containing protein, partial [Rhodanobacteraceae bacterium]